ncbi:hypothetical protein [Nocardia goodfellowii]|uniref:Transmembrane protein n=1 Tax=Nocardia goodfellowii TaxID=882446 RepID=A0ABS4QE43_9NOCA|nr:hypothetical protein [Nocardia goodfellowii]MBP2189962.1 hypothetical protein [Nocardia goodfellowii]
MSHVLPTAVSIVCVATAVTALLASAFTDACADRAARAAESCFINGDLPTDAYFTNRSRSSLYQRLTLRFLASGVVLMLVGTAVSGWATWQYIHSAH